MTIFKISYSKNSFFNTVQASNGLNLDQDRHSVVLIWVQTVFKGYQHLLKVAAGTERLKIKLLVVHFVYKFDTFQISSN